MAYDPQAVYNQTVADVELQKGWEEGNLNESLTNLQANTQYQENQITGQEPGTYRASSSRANRGGVLTSGIQGRRTNDIAAQFSARRTANTLAKEQGEARIRREREGGSLKRTERIHGAQGTLAEAQDRAARENPPVAAPPPPPGTTVVNGLTVPTGTRTVHPKYETVNGLTVPYGTRTIRPYAERRVRK